MRKSISYLCHKIDEITQTDLYKQYEKEYEQLKNNADYQRLLSEIKMIDKVNEKEHYFNCKLKITRFEMNFREVEKEINIYINHMLKRYNESFNKSKLDQKGVINNGING